MGAVPFAISRCIWLYMIQLISFHSQGRHGCLAPSSGVIMTNESISANRAAQPQRNVCKTKILNMLTMYYIKNRNWEDSWQDEYIYYLIHHLFFSRTARKRGRREDEGVEQRLDSAECVDYHTDIYTYAITSSLQLLSSAPRLSRDLVHIKSFSHSHALVFFPA